MDRFPLIVNIKRHSLEDGPGIRSVVFFKGCPLRCVFCHSPETQSPGAEIAFSARECIQCGECVGVCPEGAVDPDITGRIHRDKCNLCGKCVSVCPGKGLRLIGTYYSTDELTEILLRDSSFYCHSGGGVTISGGECTLYPSYLESLLKSLKAKGIHIVLETSGHFHYQSFSKQILPHIDLVFYDIKIADPEVHKKHLGKTNRVIIDNLYRLLQERRVEVHPRIPIVPGITATRENLSDIVDLLCDAGAESVSLLPYNPMGLAMHESLGRSIPPLPMTFMRHNEEREVYNMFNTILDEKKCLLKESVRELEGADLYS